MVRREWLQYYDVLPARAYPARVIQSWDTAVKNGAQNDYSVCTTYRPVGSLFVSARSLPETGISAVAAGDFQEILAKVADFRSLEISETYANTPQIAGISRKY
jgi:hypothetical protein